MLDLQGLHWRLEEGNLDPKEVEIARAGQVCGKDGVEREKIHCAFCCLAAPRKLTTQMGYLSLGLML